MAPDRGTPHDEVASHGVTTANRPELPVLDVQSLVRGDGAPALRRACESTGFFYVVNHGVDAPLIEALRSASERFFALPLERKLAIAMRQGGKAWRGYFPVGGELTSGEADLKEGLYFGEELGAEDPRPLHGPNLFPADVPELKPLVLRYISQLTALGHALVRGIALSLELPETYFRDHYTAHPLVLFRVFNYPPASGPRWGVGAHCDYGLLTMLWQDEAGGLEVKGPSGWIDAPPIPGSFVCNIGDMLERMTGGLYRSTLHRVRNRSGRPRLSFPFFFDPAFDALVKPVKTPGESRASWDGVDPHAFGGTYGDYLLGKVSKVFPQLFEPIFSL